METDLSMIDTRVNKMQKTVRTHTKDIPVVRADYIKMYKEFTLLQLRFEPNQIKSEVAGHFSLLSKGLEI